MNDLISNMKRLDYQRTFTEVESELLMQNHYADGSQLNWAAHFKEDRIDFEIFKTRECIFRVFLKKQGNIFVVEEAYVNNQSYHPPKWEDQCQRLDKLFEALIFKRSYKSSEDKLERGQFSKAARAYRQLRSRTLKKEIQSAYMINVHEEFTNWLEARPNNPFNPGLICSMLKPHDSWILFKNSYMPLSSEAKPLFKLWIDCHKKWHQEIKKKYKSSFNYLVPKNVFAEFYGDNSATRSCQYCNKIESPEDKIIPHHTHHNELVFSCWECHEEVDKPKYLRSVFTVTDYEAWDHLIYQAAEQFHDQYQQWPQLLVAHPETLEAFDTFMNEKLLKEGRITEPQMITQFACSKFELKICIDMNSPARTFKLIYDELASFEEEE